MTGLSGQPHTCRGWRALPRAALDPAHGLSDAAFRVLAALCHLNNGRARGRASLAALREQTGKSGSRVRAALHELVEKGFAVPETHPGQCTIWALTAGPEPGAAGKRAGVASERPPCSDSGAPPRSFSSTPSTREGPRDMNLERDAEVDALAERMTALGVPRPQALSLARARTEAVARYLPLLEAMAPADRPVGRVALSAACVGKGH